MDYVRELTQADLDAFKARPVTIPEAQRSRWSATALSVLEETEQAEQEANDPKVLKLYRTAWVVAIAYEPLRQKTSTHPYKAFSRRFPKKSKNWKHFVKAAEMIIEQGALPDLWVDCHFEAYKGKTVFPSMLHSQYSVDIYFQYRSFSEKLATEITDGSKVIDRSEIIRPWEKETPEQQVERAQRYVQELQANGDAKKVFLDWRWRNDVFANDVCFLIAAKMVGLHNYGDFSVIKQSAKAWMADNPTWAALYLHFVDNPYS